MKSVTNYIGLGLSLMLIASSSVLAEQPLIEVRMVNLRSEEKAKQFDHMMEHGAMSVLHQAGIKNVGVFQPMDPQADEAWQRILVLPYPSLEVFLNYRQGYMNEEFWQAAQAYLVQGKDDPAFSRIESSLLKPFTGMPELAVPGQANGKRIFELRTYESYSELKGKLKVQMFNEGEIELFKKVGLNAVFFGESLVAKNLPCLTYMLVHQDDEAMKAAWSRFLESPEWNEMKQKEQYQDTVSKITKHMLVATSYSDIQ
jgi:hypothetical protein